MSANITQMHYARKGIITKQMRYVAKQEDLDPKFLLKEIAEGRCIIPANINHIALGLKPIGIGIALKCKINANIGNSPISSNLGDELKKLKIAIKYGSDAIMDLSIGKDINKIRSAIIKNSACPVGTVPIYQIAVEAKGIIENITLDDIIDVIEFQAKQGVDFMTIHAGFLREHLPLLKSRIIKIVSRGGAILAEWMTKKGKQNPLYTHFDKICEIFKKYDVSFSLGDGLRPGSIADASDKAQFAELKILGKLALRAWEQDVQVMIEGPGHIPIDQIQMNVEKEIELCYGAPFYVLGPIVTDIAPGYDHITSAIGGAIAGWHGASMLCYVTPREHLGLPNEEDVKIGVVASKIAAHVSDIARKRKGVENRDSELSKARFAFDWDKQFKLAIDPETARKMHSEASSLKCYKPREFCSMCGPEFCPMKISAKIKNTKK